MGGVLSFLFDGKPPPSVTTYGTNTTNVPQWLNDYTQGVVNQGNAVAGQPYTPYGGPRLAGFSPEQQQAFEMVQGNTGKYKPLLEDAASQTQGILGQVGNSIQGNLSGASRTFPQASAEYMNPYAENVTNRAQQLANRNFNENMMPGIKDMFTRSGQYGSTRMADTVMKGARDVSEGLQSQADASLAQGWQTAGSQFAADAGRQGALAQMGVNAGLEGSGQLGQLSEALQRMGIADASALETVGKQKQQFGQANLNLAHQDFQDQKNYPKQQVEWMSNLIRGIPQSAIPTSSSTTQTGPYQGDMQASNIGSLGSLLSLWQAIQKDSGGG